MYDKFRVQHIGLFNCVYGIGGLTGDMDIFQKIKEYIEEEIEINPYNLPFKNNSFVVEVKHKNMWPYTEYFLENIDYRRRGNIERFREERRKEGEIEDLERIFEEETQALVDGINPHNLTGQGARLLENFVEPKIINAEQIFKSDECTICLSNPSNVLFCNCGHLCMFEECDKVKSLNTCPVCKTETTIKRNIRY